MIFHHSVYALDFVNRSLDGRQILLLQGPFVEGDSQKFNQAIRQIGRIDEIWFHSGGGSVVEGMAIGRKIRSLSLATRIPNDAKCYSICAFAFLGGMIREIEPRGDYGVHMFSAICQEEKRIALVNGITDIVKSKGNRGAAAIVDLLLQTEQSSARTAREQADYLLEMEVSLRLLFPNYETTCDKIHSLNRQELVSYNIVNTTR
ncbi:hypothetical protein GPROT1_01343 [Gammaproteobacteria bacterium]|nr:hypothetical protein GPROT1_01343 [Gammaproteobacteria bacterium]